MEEATSCEQCLVRLHAGCWLELGGCTTLGCPSQGGLTREVARHDPGEKTHPKQGEDSERDPDPPEPISVRGQLVLVVTLTLLVGAWRCLSWTSIAGARYPGMERFLVTVGAALGAFPIFLLISGVRCALRSGTLGESLKFGLGTCGFVTLIWGIYGVVYLATGDAPAGLLVLSLSWLTFVATGANMHRLAADHFRDQD